MHCSAKSGNATEARVVVFPADPSAGIEDGRALRCRTAAALSDAEICNLDTVYKMCWPANENPIKALEAVGFDRNLNPASTANGQFFGRGVDSG
jgi:hypothetical protein